MGILGLAATEACVSRSELNRVPERVLPGFCVLAGSSASVPVAVWPQGLGGRWFPNKGGGRVQGLGCGLS